MYRLEFLYNLIKIEFVRFGNRVVTYIVSMMSKVARGILQHNISIVFFPPTGKTTLLYKAKLNSTMFANVPPIGINIEEMTPKRGATIAVWDMRGEKLSRHLWRNYYLKTEG